MPRLARPLLATTSTAAIIAAGALLYGGAKVISYAADPQGEKQCPSLLQASAQGSETLVRVTGAQVIDQLNWKQRGGTIDDASCLSRVEVFGIVQVRSVEDIAKALQFARERGLKVTAAGVKHSMGGHAFARGGLVLDMTQFNRIQLNASARTVTVQSGATWHDIQNVLHPRFAVRAMQSTDIFTVGGSISVNAHGMDHQAGAMARSIRAMRVMLADGSIQEVSAERNRELFDLVVGGYGLFGIILDVELEVADNVIYATGRKILDYREFPELFAREIEPNKAIGLMYAHLSTAPSSFLREMFLYTYTETDAPDAQIGPLGEVGATKVRRAVFNLAKKAGAFQELKWLAEKYLEPRFEACTVTRTQAIASGEACLVSRNNPMHDSVHYLRNNLKNDTDVLHEYFIPRDRFVPFVDGLRDVLLDHGANVLNASVRVVHDEHNFLSYSPKPSFSVVLYLNQTTDVSGNEKMRKVTAALIDLTHAHGGRFFLPYQLHYSADQLKRSYPEIRSFFAAKRKYDPAGLFTNTWHERYARTVLGG